MEARFALMSLISGIGSTVLLAVMLGLRRDRHAEAVMSVVSMLLWVAIAFAQNVALTWLASLAYVAFALSVSLRVAVPRPDGQSSGHATSVFGVVSSAAEVVLAVAALDLAILVVLALLEKVIPYYVSLV